MFGNRNRFIINVWFPGNKRPILQSTVEGRGYPKINIGGHRASIDFRFRVKTYVKKMSSVDEPINLTITECESVLSCESQERIM